MARSPSSLLFSSILLFSFALLAWWTWFLVAASGELGAAGERLAAGDVAGASRALGATDAVDLQHLAARRRLMFASEGAFFALVMAGLGALYVTSRRREAAAHSAQDRFLAGATHELKTPLATIVLLLESLRDDRIPPAKRGQYLDTGLQEAERLGRGLDNVLVAAGLRTAPRALHRVAGDLTADVARAVAAVRGRALASEVALEVAAADPVPLSRDDTAVQLVLRNLLDNAIKYSPPGRRVQVAVAATATAATVTVRDEGRGMAAEELARAFAPFWRGDDTATGGTGLGLHLVGELVRAHGGSVTAHSDGPGRGAVFTVTLPRGGDA